MLLGYFLNLLGFIVLNFFSKKKVKLSDGNNLDWKFVRVGAITLIILGFIFGKLIEYAAKI
jgi:hypothetical protein